MTDADLERQAKDFGQAFEVCLLFVVIMALLALLLPERADADVKKQTEGEWFLVVTSSPQFPSEPTYEACELRKAKKIAADAATKFSGKTTYYCRRGTEIEFGPAPAPTCSSVPRPLAETRTQTCPAGTVGTFGQTREYVQNPNGIFPDSCWIPGQTWLPESSELCLPADSDGDGVPDSSDKCPTVNAAGPDGCPVSPSFSSVLTFATTPRGTYAPLDGKTVSGTIYVKLSTCELNGTAGWQFFLDGVKRWDQEFSCPFFYMGDENPIDTRAMPNGQRTLEAKTNAAWTASARFTVDNAAPVNRAPTIAGTPSTSVQVGANYVFYAQGSDADGDVLGYSIANLPRWATFNPTTARLSGTPTAAHIGSYPNVTISVSDGRVSASLAPFSVTVTPATSGTNGTATLEWTAPTHNDDGSALTDLAGYRIVYGESPSVLQHSIEITGASLTKHTITGLSAGTYYFALIAVSEQGNTSKPTGIVSTTIAGA
jgi:hypothetical protein